MNIFHWIYYCHTSLESQESPLYLGKRHMSGFKDRQSFKQHKVDTNLAKKRDVNLNVYLTLNLPWLTNCLTDLYRQQHIVEKMRFSTFHQCKNYVCKLYQL